MSSIANIRLILLGAFLIGIGCSSFFYLVFSFGQIPPQARIFDFWIPLVVLIFMTILIRAKKPGQPFHFWEGLISGNLMLWLGGLISGICIWLLTKYNATFFDTFISSSVRYLVESDRYAPPALKVKDLSARVTEIKATQPVSLIMDEAIKKVYYSFLLVPFVSMIFRRK
jgi:hypothetical protein